MRQALFRMSMLYAAAGCAAVLAQSASPMDGKLSSLIPTLYGPGGLTLPNAFHEAHFSSSFQEDFTPINNALASQLVLLPIASPASGFVYNFDPAAGLVRSSESFGPILAERADTIGRYKLFVGFSFQHTRFDTIDGMSLGSLPAVFQHERETGAAYEEDYITTNNSVKLSLNQFTLFGTFGLTNRLDVSLAVPIVRASLDVSSDAVIQRLAAPSPTFGQSHYFDAADPDNSIHKVYSASGDASGIGDVVLRVKGTVFKAERGGIALAADVRFPSGDPYNFLGSGAAGFKPFIAGSMSLGRVAPHVNLGYQWNGESVLAGNVSTGEKRRLPNQLFYAAGADIGATRRITLAFDLLGQRVFGGPRVFQTTYTSAVGQTAPEFALGQRSFNIVDGAAGFKFDLVDRLLVTASLLFRLNDAGMRARTSPLVGISYTF